MTNTKSDYERPKIEILGTLEALAKRGDSFDFRRLAFALPSRPNVGHNS